MSPLIRPEVEKIKYNYDNNVKWVKHNHRAIMQMRCGLRCVQRGFYPPKIDILFDESIVCVETNDARLQFCILPRTSMNGSPSSTGRYFYHLTRILLVRIFLSAADFVVVLEECKFVGTGKVLSKGERNGISEKCNQLKLPQVVFGLVSIFLIARMNCPPLDNNNNIGLPHERSSIAMILL